jgi:hypothetical protein
MRPEGTQKAITDFLNGYGNIAEAVAASTQTFATEHIPFKLYVNNKRKPENLIVFALLFILRGSQLQKPCSANDVTPTVMTIVLSYFQAGQPSFTSERLVDRY